jgi:hypothetical protein
VFRRSAYAIALLAGLAPTLGHAQTNIDQGKSPAEVFANDCATCHKAARGLAHGRGTSDLGSFLAEHYTASREQASALAAYVMGAGGGDALPATPGRGQKPVTGQARVEEPKPATQPRKPEDGTPATARLQSPAGEETKKPGDVPGIVQEPGAAGRKPALSRRETPPPAAGKGHPKEPETAPPQEPAAAAEASPAAQEANPASAPGAIAGSDESAPIPRDNIPD